MFRLHLQSPQFNFLRPTTHRAALRGRKSQPKFFSGPDWDDFGRSFSIMRSYMLGMQLIEGGFLIALWIMWAQGIIGWIGGGFISVFLAPAMVVYPLIHWFVEGTWPVTFIIVFAVAFGVGGDRYGWVVRSHVEVRF